MLNGHRVDVRQSIMVAIDDEMSKKLISIFFYGNYNYSYSLNLVSFLQSQHSNRYTVSMNHEVHDHQF